MNLLKYKGLLVGGAIVLVLVLASIGGLLHFQGVYSKAARELKSANDKLDRLNRRNPFPAEENVTIIQQNRDALNAFLASLQHDFRAGQVAEETMEPARFANLLEKNIRDLTVKATNMGTKLPERFALGFGRYVAGELPAVADIPRLVVQTRTVSAVCDLLLEARIGELVSVERTPFEAHGAEGGPKVDIRAALAGTPDAPTTQLLSLPLPPAQSNDLFVAERLAVTFLAREHSAWEVLNALARSPLFAVVVHVEIVNDANPKTPGVGRDGHAAPGLPPAVAPGAPPPVAGAPIIYPSREERVLAGRENVRVGLVIDVYRFAGAPAAEGAK